MVRAAQVRTERSKGRNRLLAIFHDPGAVLDAAGRPTIYPVSMKRDLPWRSRGRQIRDIAGIRPFALLLVPRRAKQIQTGRKAERSRYNGHEHVNRGFAKVSAFLLHTAILGIPRYVDCCEGVKLWKTICLCFVAT